MKRTFRIAAITLVTCLGLGATACSSDLEGPAGSSSSATTIGNPVGALLATKKTFDDQRSSLDSVDQRGRDQIVRLGPALDAGQLTAYKVAFGKGQSVKDAVNSWREASLQLSTTTSQVVAQTRWADADVQKGGIAAMTLMMFVALADSPWSLGALEGAAKLQTAGPMRTAFVMGVDADRGLFSSIPGVASAKDGGAALDLVIDFIHDHGMANAFLDLVMGTTTGTAQSPDGALATLTTLVSNAAANGPSGTKAVAAAMDLVRERKLTAIDEALKIENKSGLVRGIKSVGVAYGIVQAGSYAANGDFVDAVKSLVSAGPDGAVVLGQTAHALRWALFGTEGAEKLVALGMKVGPVTDTISALLNLATGWDPNAKMMMAGDVLSVLGAIATFSAVAGPEGVVIAGIGVGVQMLAAYLDGRAAAAAEHDEILTCLEGAGITGDVAAALAGADSGQLAALRDAGVGPGDIRWFGSLMPDLLVDTHSGAPQVDGLASLKRACAFTPAQETALLHALPAGATSANDPKGAGACYGFLRDTSTFLIGLGATPSRTAWIGTLEAQASRTPGPGGTALKNAAAYLKAM